MTWQGVGLTDIGHVRTTNQDAYSVNNGLKLWIVADGMGSHQHSDIASKMAVKSINAFLEDHANSTTIGDVHHWQIILRKAVIHAHDAIRTEGKVQSDLAGMGTTVVLVFMPNPVSNEMHIAHAGDSRAYLLRDNTLTLLTRDHTLLEERIRDGLLPKDTPASHKLGHVLTKVVGIDSAIDADCSHITLQQTDTIILCSDGLIKMMNDEEICQVLLSSRHDIGQDSCRALIEEANRLGGQDNVTVVMIQNNELSSRSDIHGR
ncbi:MAG: protein phosphatase 2C domain-containing protein [Nitrospirota bacterium]|nr:protein phosphatase 2C domain-containing protein [Nitrospirota bacterium]